MNKRTFALSIAIALAARAAFAQEAAPTPSDSAPPMSEQPAALPMTDPAVTAPASDASPGTPPPSEEGGAAAAAPDDGTSKDVAKDASLAALGVGEYGKKSELFVLWENQKTGAYIKPILWISSSLIGYFPQRDGNPDYSDRTATLLVSRFGFEGALTDFASFKTEFQRDLGFSLSTNGPQGTSVFEGTASIQARENYINLHKWGLSLLGGIQTDPASVDFISNHVLGMFGMDPFTRDYLLNAGFSLGQGFLARYEIPHLQEMGLGRLTFGFQYASGNPLITSLSYGFGGNVTSTGTLYSAPLRSLSFGTPGTNIALQTYSPSLTYSIDFTKKIGFDLRLGAQWYHANVDTTSATDATVNGSNYRGTARIRLPYVNLMGSLARRVNQQIALPDLTRRLGDNFEATIWSAGAEINYGRYGAGAHYAQVRQEQFNNSHQYAKYFNVGATYQIVPGFLSTQLRYSSVQYDYENISSTPTNAKMVSGSLILTI